MIIKVLIDGIPVKELDIKWLREKIGFVGQVLLNQPVACKMFFHLNLQ